MNKIKKSIIILFILILLTSTFLIFFMLKKDTKENTDNQNVVTETKEVLTKEVKTYEEYVIVKNIINRYLVYNSLKDIEAIYAMLDKDYIKSNNITEQNLMKKIKNIKKTEFIINEIKCQELTEYNTKYIVKCYIYSNIDDDSEEIKERDYEEINFQVLLDKFNATFSIIPQE